VPTVVPTLAETVGGAHFSPDLARVVVEWARLPEAIKAGILALVQAGGEPRGGHA